MKTSRVFSVLVLSLVVSGCAFTTVSPTESIPQSTTVITKPAQELPVAATDDDVAGLVRTDEQGAVQFSVTPLNLVNPGDTLDFEVSMSTHSVELGMDLAKLATLSTDNGQKVVARAWDAPGGGHHVAGKLLFPSSVDGKLLLKGATKVTLSLRDIDAPERVFTWDLK